MRKWVSVVALLSGAAFGQSAGAGPQRGRSPTRYAIWIRSGSVAGWLGVDRFDVHRPVEVLVIEHVKEKPTEN